MNLNFKNNKAKIIIGLLLVAIVTMVTMCCTKDNPFVPPNPPVDEPYWDHFLVMDNTFLNFITNSTVVYNRLICTVRDGLMMIDDLSSGQVAYLKPLYSNSTGYDCVPILSNEAVVYTQRFMQNMIIFNNYHIYLMNAASIQPRDIEEQFKDYFFYTDVPFQNTFGAMNSQNRFVTVITDREHPSGRNNVVVYSDIVVHSSGVTEITNSGYWTISSMLGSRLSITDIFAYQDKFYIAYTRNEAPDTGNFYIEISANGSMREFRDTFDRGILVYSFFEYKGVLFAQTTDRMLRYTHDGENWNAAVGLNPVVNTYKEIDDYIFVHSADNIIIISEIFHDVKMYRLPKENMVGVAIRSINKFHDDLVITTSHGIFYKSFEDVMNDKELIFPLGRGAYIDLEGDFL